VKKENKEIPDTGPKEIVIKNMHNKAKKEDI